MRQRSCDCAAEELRLCGRGAAIVRQRCCDCAAEELRLCGRGAAIVQQRSCDCAAEELRLCGRGAAIVRQRSCDCAGEVLRHTLCEAAQLHGTCGRRWRPLHHRRLLVCTLRGARGTSGIRGACSAFGVCSPSDVRLRHIVRGWAPEGVQAGATGAPEGCLPLGAWRVQGLLDGTHKMLGDGHDDALSRCGRLTRIAMAHPAPMERVQASGCICEEHTK